MIIEVRTYTIKPGKRDEFVEFFHDKLMAEYAKYPIKILGAFTSVDDENTFVWLRAFDDAATRDKALEEYYGSDRWNDTLKPQAQTMVESVDVKVVEPTSYSAIS